MRTVAEYLRHAEECEALARKAQSPEQRETILEMAQAWRTLAATREKLLRAGTDTARTSPEDA